MAETSDFERKKEPQSCRACGVEGTAVPEWVKEDLPDWVKPYVGEEGLPEPWEPQKGVLGGNVTGIDRWHAHHFITYCEETSDFLDNQYSPTDVSYVKGTFPACEKLVARYTSRTDPPCEQAAVLAKAVPEILAHPTIPPGCKWCGPDRNLDEEGLLHTGAGWCNEQARVFIRLCQVAGIPGRLISLFYSDKATGHVAAEFYAGGRWSLADQTWAVVFPDGNGALMSAAQVHHTAAGRDRAHALYRARFEELLKFPDDQLSTYDHGKMRDGLLSKLETVDGHLWRFGVLNYPLPR